MRKFQFLVISVVFAAAAVAQPDNAGAQTVIDNKGKMVGALYGQEYGGQRQNVIRKLSKGVFVSFPIVAEGLLQTQVPAFYYTSADCTGIAYLENDLNQLVQAGAFATSDPDYRFSVKGTLVYGGGPRMRLAVYSTRWKYQEGGEGQCQTVEPTMMTVRPAVEQNISDWRLTAPFKIK